MAGLPTLSELLNALAFLGQEPAALGVLATALALIVLRDWRWSLLALIVQYILTGWLLTDVLEPQVAVLKILIGLMISVVLYLTARQVRWGHDPSSGDAGQHLHIGRWVLPTAFLFRVLIALLVGAVILQLTGDSATILPGLSPHINRAAIALMALGLLALGLTDEPLRAGMGLLTFLSGFELFYHSLEQAITVIGLVIAIDFLVAIITAYLTVARHMNPNEAERREQT